MITFREIPHHPLYSRKAFPKVSFGESRDDGDFYTMQAASYYAQSSRYPSPVARFFREAFPKSALNPKPQILDMGAGTCRDLILLINEGYEAFGIDPSRQLLDLSIQEHSKLKERVKVGSLPDQIPSEFQQGNLDGILSNAVLMHIPDEDLTKSIQSMNAALKPGGRVLLYVCSKRPGLNQASRDADGRLFILRSANAIQSAFEREGFTLQRFYPPEADKGQRADIEWETYIFEKS